MEFLNETYHILAFYICLIIFSAYILLFSRKMNSFFLQLDKKVVTKGNAIFKLTYLAIIILAAIILTAIILIEINFSISSNFYLFFAYALFSFLIMPVALGLLLLYISIITKSKYSLGRDTLLGICAICFGLYESNLHDFIWCGVHTNWYSKEHLGGYDIAFFFNMFGIFDKSAYDYRIFGFYALIQIFLELTIGISAYYKYYQLNFDIINENKLFFRIFPFLLLIIGGLLGIITFMFDAPWFFTLIQYKIIIYCGIPGIAILFALLGYFIGKKSIIRE